MIRACPGSPCEDQVTKTLPWAPEFLFGSDPCGPGWLRTGDREGAPRFATRGPGHEDFALGTPECARLRDEKTRGDFALGTPILIRVHPGSVPAICGR